MRGKFIEAHEQGQNSTQIATTYNTTEETVNAIITGYGGFKRLPDNFPKCDDAAIDSKISEHIEHLRFETIVEIINVKTAIVGMLRAEQNARATKKQSISATWTAAISIIIAVVSLAMSLFNNAAS